MCLKATLQSPEAKIYNHYAHIYYNHHDVKQHITYIQMLVIL